VWFNITEQSINELAITKEATQFKSNHTVKAYVTEHDGGSTIYIYIKSTLTNRFRRFLRFENEGNATLNGSSFAVVGARTLFTFTMGPHYIVAINDGTFWLQEPTGDYTLRIYMVRRHYFSFRLLFNVIFSLTYKMAGFYILFTRIAQKRQAAAIT